MIEEIKRRLDAGEVVELECVDREGYKRENPDERWSVLNLDKIIVTSAHLAGVSIKNANVAIMRYELKYFRIKQDPTFKDLVNVAVQAVEDKLIIINCLTDWQLQFVRGSDTRYIVSHDSGRIMREMDFIKSLYTETFVIESEEDTNKLISGGKTVLKNGEVLEFSNNYKGTLYFNLNDYESDAFPFVALKGATVTQKRGK